MPSRWKRTASRISDACVVVLRSRDTTRQIRCSRTVAAILRLFDNDDVAAHLVLRSMRVCFRMLRSVPIGNVAAGLRYPAIWIGLANRYRDDGP